MLLVYHIYMYVYMKTARNYKNMTVSFWVVSDENCAKSKI